MIHEQDIPAVVALHDQFRLTAKEALVVLLLARGGVVDTYRIRDVYADSPMTPAIEARSAVKRIRKKVGQAIRIRAHYGEGYSLEDESRKRVREMMKETRQ
jgi:DNA-binding response OmpR family regulator